MRKKTKKEIKKASENAKQVQMNEKATKKRYKEHKNYKKINELKKKKFILLGKALSKTIAINQESDDKYTVEYLSKEGVDEKRQYELLLEHIKMNAELNGMNQGLQLIQNTALRNIIELNNKRIKEGDKDVIFLKLQNIYYKYIIKGDSITKHPENKEYNNLLKQKIKSVKEKIAKNTKKSKDYDLKLELHKYEILLNRRLGVLDIKNKKMSKELSKELTRKEVENQKEMKKIHLDRLKLLKSNQFKFKAENKTSYAAAKRINEIFEIEAEVENIDKFVDNYNRTEEEVNKIYKDQISGKNEKKMSQEEAAKLHNDKMQKMKAYLKNMEVIHDKDRKDIEELPENDIDTLNKKISLLLDEIDQEAKNNFIEGFKKRVHVNP